MPSSPSEQMLLKKQLDREEPGRKKRKLDSMNMFGNINVSIMVDDNDNLWYKVVDLARALEMEDPNASVGHIIEGKNCRNYETLKMTSSSRYARIPGMNPKTTFVNEMGMYEFVLNSPKAETFVEWVCGAILPSICSTNSYEVDPADNPLGDVNEFLKQNK